MAELTGSSFYLEFDGLVLTSDYRNFNDGLKQDMVEVTAGLDTLRHYTKTLEIAEPELTIIVDSDATGLAIYNKLKLGAAGVLVWGPKGATAGMPKWGLPVEVSEVPTDVTYDSERELTVKFMPTAGTWTYDGRTTTF
jgi:hypothetical protein